MTSRPETERPGKPPVVMTIAGFDPSGGAGVLADIKTIAAFGCYGVAAVTSLTFQNTMEVRGAFHQSPETVRRQIEPIFDDFCVAAIKTGMLGTSGIVGEVADLIKRSEGPVVVDPVLSSTSGAELTDDRSLRAIATRLIPLAAVVTPNIAEAHRLTGVSIRDESTMLEAATAIIAMGARAVVITGGDLGADSSPDFLLDGDGPARFPAPRIKSVHTHGTGCAFSSAIACLLARGTSLRESIPIAKRYIAEAILGAPDLGRGHGPLNHFHQREDR